MSTPSHPPAEQERSFHTYVTHRIPWYVHVMWIVFIMALIGYIAVYAVPSAKELL